MLFVRGESYQGEALLGLAGLVKIHIFLCRLCMQLGRQVRNIFFFLNKKIKEKKYTKMYSKAFYNATYNATKASYVGIVLVW